MFLPFFDIQITAHFPGPEQTPFFDPLFISLNALSKPLFFPKGPSYLPSPPRVLRLPHFTFQFLLVFDLSYPLFPSTRNFPLSVPPLGFPLFCISLNSLCPVYMISSAPLRNGPPLRSPGLAPLPQSSYVPSAASFPFPWHH